ncbi:MAG: hypothetical protein EXS25_04750 [Pedosphaera sp.]|nr:hypothetical protein [Pedosphaera sp.]
MIITSRFQSPSALVLAALIAGPAWAQETVKKTETFHQRRTALIKKNDLNQDGRLDEGEREKMRLALKKQRFSKSNSAFQVPADFLAKYDEDKNGEMAGNEWKIAWETETKILKKTYDEDKDGSLNLMEKNAMMIDVGKGKITGIPAFFAGGMAQESDSANPDFVIAQKKFLKFDTNHDGIATAEELRQIRNALPNSR